MCYSFVGQLMHVAFAEQILFYFISNEYILKMHVEFF